MDQIILAHLKESDSNIRVPKRKKIYEKVILSYTTNTKYNDYTVDILEAPVFGSNKLEVSFADLKLLIGLKIPYTYVNDINKMTMKTMIRLNTGHLISSKIPLSLLFKLSKVIETDSHYVILFPNTLFSNESLLMGIPCNVKTVIKWGNKMIHEDISVILKESKMGNRYKNEWKGVTKLPSKELIHFMKKWEHHKSLNLTKLHNCIISQDLWPDKFLKGFYIISPEKICGMTFLYIRRKDEENDHEFIRLDFDDSHFENPFYQNTSKILSLELLQHSFEKVLCPDLIKSLKHYGEEEECYMYWIDVKENLQNSNNFISVDDEDEEYYDGEDLCFDIALKFTNPSKKTIVDLVLMHNDPFPFKTA
jgi:hypothetical protein